jgi:hypothetical protein
VELFENCRLSQSEREELLDIFLARLRMDAHLFRLAAKPARRSR